MKSQYWGWMVEVENQEQAKGEEVRKPRGGRAGQEGSSNVQSGGQNPAAPVALDHVRQQKGSHHMRDPYLPVFRR